MKKKKSKRCIKPFLWMFVFIVLLFGAGFFIMNITSQNKGKTSAEIVAEIERDSLLLQADRVEFQVGESAEVVLTVTSYEVVNGTIVVTDNKGTELLTMELKNEDGLGVASGTIVVEENEPRRMELTASLNGEASAPLALYVSPEVTFDMVKVCMQVAQELGEALVDAGYEKIDEEAVNDAEQWLLNDARVSEVVRMDNGVFFYTQDGLVGCCSLTPEEGMLGSGGFHQGDTDPVYTYKKWEKRGEPFLEEYINSENTLTNNSILVLQPMYNSAVYSDFENPCNTEVYTEIAYKVAKALESKEALVYRNENASSLIFQQAMNRYGLIIMNTHGDLIGEAGTIRQEKTWVFQLRDGIYLNALDGKLEAAEEYLADVMGFSKTEKAYSRLFAKHHEDAKPEDCLMYIGVDLGKEETEEEREKNGGEVKVNVGLHGTYNLLETLYQNKAFDNSIVYFGCCYSLCNPEVARFFLNRGAVAYIGYSDAVWSPNEYENAKDFFENLVSEKNDIRWKNIQESMEDRIGYAHFWFLRSAKSMYDHIESGRPTDQRMYGMTTQLEFTLHGIGSLESQVLEKESEEPIGNAVVQLYHWINQEFILEKETVTDKDGAFKLEDIPWGVYVAKVTTEDGNVTWADCILADEKSKADTIYIERNLSYYPYVKNELIPKLGLFEIGEKKEMAYDFVDYDWDSRTGIVSAAIKDMNGDGIDDMVLVYVKKEDVLGNGLLHQTLYADMYTMEDGVIVKKNSVLLDEFNNCENHEIWVSMYPYQNKDGKDCYDLFVQSYAKGCFVDYSDPIYARFCFDGEGLRKVFHIEQSQGGTSEVAFSNYVYNVQTGEDDEEIVWGDLLYLDFGGQPGVYNQMGITDVTDMIVQFMKEHMPVEIQSYTNGFPSYIGSLELESVMIIGNSGPYMGGEFTMAVADDTALREELKKLEEE